MEDTEKKKRKRMKKLCKDIRQQMEFYFSDANLHKDRFLKQQINQSSDGWLKLDIFSNFNKLKKLSSDLEVISKALTTSQLLQVSDDGKKVKRKVALSEPKDVDDRTVYVECLPSDANHDWVKTTFSHHGKVVYVSLPKYKSTGDIKGFAFVEFETIKEAKNACEMMNNPPVSQSDHVGMFPVKGNKDVQRMQKILNTQRGPQTKRGRRPRTVSETEVATRRAEVQEEAKSKKRTRLWSQAGSGDEDGDLSVKRLKTDTDKQDDSSSSTSDSSSDDEPVTKKKKPDKSGSDCTETKPDKSGSDCTETKAVKRKHDESEEESPQKKVKITVGSSDEEDNKKDSAEKKKKRKKRKKKVKEDKKNIPELRVIPKKEWQELRDEYIKLQKQSMTDLKTSLKKIRNKEVDNPDKENSAVITKDPLPEDMEADAKCGKKGNQLEFTPDVIVYVQSEVALNRKQLKDDLSTFGEIKYIELIDGDNTAHIRCATPQVAAEIAEASVDKHSFSILEGESEKKYWDKILLDREKKLSSKSKSKKRGKDKAIGKVAQMREEVNKKSHIHFEEDT